MYLEDHRLTELKKYDISLCSHLCKDHNQEFHQWWDPEKFNWRFYSRDLAQYCSDYFDLWYSDYFNWEHSDYLCKFCPNYFNIWWDPEKFDWTNFSLYLAKYCNEYFNTWWNPERI